MPILVWDRPEERTYETGLDRGVLYLPDGTAVPWNGLTAVIEKNDREVTEVYYDGAKINDLVTIGSFSATMKAVTYPDEFIELEGATQLRSGFYANDQSPTTFGLCYRSRIGNALDGDVSAYKLHLLYNVTATPADKTYATAGDDPSLVEFEWDISAVPENIPGIRPTAHITVDSRELDPWLLEDLEEMLYGASFNDAYMLPMPEFVSWINNWYRVLIKYNGDGTWTAIAEREGVILFDKDDPTKFSIVGANAFYIDDVTYEIATTRDIKDIKTVVIRDNFDGTWTASTSTDDLIELVDDGDFILHGVNIIFESEDMYRVALGSSE